MNVQHETEAPPRRLWKSHILRQVVVALFVLAVAEVWHLWGWRLGGLQFHESWTEAQRAELLELDACLLAAPMRALVIDEISEDGDEEDEETSETQSFHTTYQNSLSAGS